MADKKEITKEDLEKIAGGFVEPDPEKGTYGMVLMVCKNCRYQVYSDDPDSFGSCPDCGSNDWMRFVW